MRIVHVITGLNPGGAETMLLRLLGAVDREAWDPHVISLTDLGEIAEGLRDIGIPLFAAGMARGGPLPLLAAIKRLTGELRRLKPDLVQTWMYHANLVGGLSSRLAGRPPLIWSIRQTNLDAESVRRSTALVAHVGARLSPFLPDRILYNSVVSRRAHEAIGYNAAKALVAPNGFDLGVFYPDDADRRAVRQELELNDSHVVVGLVARFDPQKDHRTFLRAASTVAKAAPDTAFVLAGLEIDRDNRALTDEIGRLGLQDNVRLLGHRRDVPRLLRAFDIGCLSSMGEGFPNAVGEAMATALPCVVTDVGDSAYLLGDCGNVVPPRQPEALADGLLKLVRARAAERHALGLAARERVKREFSLAAVAQRHMDIWSAVLHGHDHR